MNPYAFSSKRLCIGSSCEDPDECCCPPGAAFVITEVLDMASKLCAPFVSCDGTQPKDGVYAWIYTGSFVQARSVSVTFKDGIVCLSVDKGMVLSIPACTPFYPTTNSRVLAHSFVGEPVLVLDEAPELSLLSQLAERAKTLGRSEVHLPEDTRVGQLLPRVRELLGVPELRVSDVEVRVHGPDHYVDKHIDHDCGWVLAVPLASDHDGGELAIWETLGTPDDFRVQRRVMPRGKAVLFPADLVHAVTQVTRGTRVSCIVRFI